MPSTHDPLASALAAASRPARLPRRQVRFRLAAWPGRFAAALLAVLLLTSSVRAGLGPENLIVVVNAKSQDSRTIANHFVQLRHIPSRNVIFLDDVPEGMITSLEVFRERILRPLLTTIAARELTPQVRAIAYSAGFPYAVRIQEHRNRLEDDDLKKAFTPTASINGLTYYYQFILQDSDTYLRPASNLYTRVSWRRHFENPFLRPDEESETFDRAKQNLEDGAYAEAAKAFAQLLERYPQQAPFGVLAARGHALAGEPEAAIDALRAAVKAGWSNGTALRDDEQLASLKERPDFGELLNGLNDAPLDSQLAVAFEPSRGWMRNGWWGTPQQGITYLPACMLAVTRGQGTSVAEAIEYLTRAAEADGTFPEGTVYLTKTRDVRTRTREPNFAAAESYLGWLGRKVNVENRKLPKGASDVIGITFGTAKYDWPATGSQLLPGAIGDNLTSTSGQMRGSGQTKLTELLKAGAAMASGTVVEPYALQFKFPLPTIHAFYAEGASALEAYYMSLANPYQLLIVGDPLCQPFARTPQAAIAGGLGQADGEQAVLIRLQQVAAEKPEQTSPLRSVEIFLDGKLVNRDQPRPMYRMKIGSLPGGAYELRVVLVGEPRLAPRKTIRTWFDAPGLLPAPTATQVTAGPKSPEQAERLNFKLEAVGADSIRLQHFEQTLATLDGDEGDVEVDLEPLGKGPIRLRAVATFRGTDVPGREFVVQNDN